jgi:hypothetical protein
VSGLAFYAAGSPPVLWVSNGANASNAHCTGWGFYAWGALNGLIAILEAQHA